MLELQGLTKRFGGLTALKDCTLTIEAGSAVGLVGPNGSGKTTLANAVTGFIKPDSGRVLFQAQDITGRPPYQIYRSGLVRTFQTGGAHRNLSVEENVALSSWGSAFDVFWSIFSATGLVGRIAGRQLNASPELQMPPHNLSSLVNDLSFGQSRLVEINRAVLTKAKLLVLDEPTAGLDPDRAGYLKGVIEIHRTRGRSFLIIEHNLGFLHSTCDRVIVLDRGMIRFDGPTSELRSHYGPGH